MIKILQSEDLTDEDVLDILRDLVCIPPKSIYTDMYRPTYQPYHDGGRVYGTLMNNLMNNSVAVD
jgi:hypothetical protein